MKKLIVLLAALAASGTSWGRAVQTQALLNIRSADGVVSAYPYQLKVSSNSLTNNGDGTVSLSVMPSIPAIQSITLTSSATTTNTFALTRSSATITPSSNTRRVKITVSGMLVNANSTLANAYWSIDRSGTNIGTATGFGRMGVAAGVIFSPVSYSVIDSPATSGPVVYTVTIRNDDGATSITYGLSGQQTMILEDVP